MDNSSSSQNGVDDTLPVGAEKLDSVLSVVMSLKYLSIYDDEMEIEFDEAVNFVKKIETTFQNDPRVFKLFAHILEGYPKNRKSLNDIFEEVKVLFRNYQYLIEEFDKFLPSDLMTSHRQERSICEESRDKHFKVTTEEALSYLSVVKQTLGNSKKYEDFMNVLIDFKRQKIDADNVISKVKEIFGKNKTLFTGFCMFLPKEYEACVAALPR